MNYTVNFLSPPTPYTPPMGAPSQLSAAQIFLPGLLGQIVNELESSGIDPSIVLAESLAFASLLTQGVADVLWPNGIPAPIGANVLLASPSSSGKTVIFMILMGPITEFLDSYTVEGDQAITPAFLVEDISRVALIQHLREWRVAALFTTEAGQVIELLKHGASTLAKLLDGETMRHARGSTERVEIKDPRLTMLLMAQPEIYDDLKVSLGGTKGGVGVPNRFFHFRSKSMPGGTDQHCIGLSEATSQRYTQRVHDLLGRSIKNVLQKQKRQQLKLAPAAMQYFCHMTDGVRHEQATNPRLSGIVEYFSRLPERVLRLSGTMHAFEFDGEPEIELSTLQIAEELGRASVETFYLANYEPPKSSQAEADAQILDCEFQKAGFPYRGLPVPLSVLRRIAMNNGLSGPRFNRAFETLAKQGLVSMVLQGRVDRVWFLPQYERQFRLSHVVGPAQFYK